MTTNVNGINIKFTVAVPQSVLNELSDILYSDCSIEWDNIIGKWKSSTDDKADVVHFVNGCWRRLPVSDETLNRDSDTDVTDTDDDRNTSTLLS